MATLMTASSTDLHPATVLGAYVASHVDGRRVALIGNCRNGLAEQLAALAGRRIHAYDPEAERVATSVAEATRKAHSARISFNVLEDDLDFREGAFDVAIVPELGLFDDAESVVALVESLVGQRGLVFFGIRNAPDDRDEPMGYYELYDLVATRFEHVKMLGQASFSGATIADFAAENEPPVTIDSSLMSQTAEPTHFIAAASGASIELDPYTLVQLPGPIEEHTAAARADEAQPATSAQNEAAQRDEVDKLKAQLARYERLARDRQDNATQLAARVAELEAELNAASDEDRKRQEEHDDHVDQQEFDQLFERIADLEEIASQVDSLEAKLQTAQEALATCTPAGAADDPEAMTDLVRLEAALKERAEKIQSIEGVLQESERVGRALAKELQAATTRDAPPETAPDERTARYEADLHAAQWKLAAMESELSEYRDAGSDHDALAEALTAAQATIATMQHK